MVSPRQLRDLSSPSWIPSVPDELPLLAELPAQPGLSLVQITTILASYWKQTLIIGLTMSGLTAVAVKLMPKTYTAVATLIVNAGNSDPLAANEVPTDMLANYIATQTELMLSPVILLPAVDRLKLTEDPDFAGGFSGRSPNALRDYVEKNLSTELEIDQGRGGELLYISASAKDPVKAADIANTVADVYLAEEQRRINDPAGERAQRYSTELAELRAKVTAAQDKVIRFQQQHGITDLTAAANNDTETQALSDLEQQLLAAQSKRRQLEAQTTGQEASTTEVMTSPVIQQLKTQLDTEESELAQARTVYGPHHPKVLEFESQIAATNRSLAAEIRTFSSDTLTQLSRARELEASLTKAVDAQHTKVMNLRQLQDEGAKLVVELDSAQAVYKRALDGYDQILFAAVGKEANVSFISRATPPARATKPNKVKLLLVGSFVGFLLGLAVPAAYELLIDRRLRCRDDIERDFGIPVLAQFGPIPADAVSA